LHGRAPAVVPGRGSPAVTRRVRLLGLPRIEDGQLCPPPRGLKSWAVLARVALAGRPVGRSELAGKLFGEADDPLGALRWCLADLRRSLGLPSLLHGDPLALSPGELWVDVRALEDGSLPGEDIGGELLGPVLSILGWFAGSFSGARTW
jgi:hypothetical protein